MKRTSLVATVSLVLLGLGSSLTNLGNGFPQDDIPVIERNGVIHSLAEPWTFFTQSYWPKPFSPALYRPLATTGFAVQWAIGGGKAWLFRAVSDVMYIAAGLAVFHLAGLLLPALAAWLVAAFFMVHPVHVEAVAVAVNQSELMVGFLAALVVILYLAVRRRTGGLKPSHGIALFLLYLAATLFKESGLMIIGLLVAAELTVVQDDRPIKERLARIRPTLLVMLLGAAMFFAIRTFALEGDPVGTFTAEALYGQSMGGRALTMLGVVPHWYRLLLWPAHLRGDYSPREIEQATTWGYEQTQGLALVILPVLLAIICWRRLPVVTFGLLWTAIGIFPVSNVVVPTGIVLAERTLFLPSIGMMLVIGGLAVPVIDWLRTRPKALRFAAAGAVGAVLVMGLTRSASRQLVWKDQMTFWYQTTIDAPLSYRAHHALAYLLFDVGVRGQAERHYKTAIALYPESWGARFELANRLRLAGQCEPASSFYRQALVIEPQHENARTSLIACFLFLGRYADAKAEAREGVSYATRPAMVKLFQRLMRLSDSAIQAKAPAETVRIRILPSDTLP